jgi:SAM-dependent methyltransferase
MKMSLEDKIVEQYRNRVNSDDLYNSEYSRRADTERFAKARQLIDKYAKQKESVLEIGAGQGDNVPLFEYCGFTHICLNELLPDRIATAIKKYPHLKMYAGNAIDIEIPEKFDCVYQSTVFTSILSDDDRTALADKMWSLVKPGGMVLWYDFVYNNPRNRAVKKVTAEEVRRLFPLATTSEIIKVTLAPPVGRRVGKLYKLFNLPFLRSHILAVFLKE